LDVRAVEDSDGLVVIPPRGADIHSIVEALRALVGPGAVRRNSSGIRIAAGATPRLLDPQNLLSLRWSVEARVFAENRRRVQETYPGYRGELERIRQGGASEIERRLAGLGPLQGLDPHQRENVAAMTLPGGFGLCVFDEQGTGKTVTMIGAHDILVGQGEIDLTLIIAPKSMVAEWAADFERFMGTLYRVRLLAGARAAKVDALRAGADVFIANFEAAVSLEHELTAILRRREHRAMLVVDESFFAKSIDARRTRVLRRLREWCGRAFVLCGTPAPNRAEDVIEQFNLVDFGVTFDGVDVPEDREAARTVVQAAMEARGCFVRHLKQEVLPGLPARRFHRVLVPMAPRQASLYKAGLDSLVTDLQATSDADFLPRRTSFLARRSMLLQACSNPAGFVPGYDETPAKLGALDALLADLILGQREKVVVWSFYTASVDAIVARYGQYQPVRYDGTVADVGDRRTAVARFQEDDQTMLFVGNPAAAGAGLTLHRARVAVYESFSNQAAHYLQSLDRIHRRGQARNVEYIVLLCEGTIEIEEYARLTRKERAAQQLLGDVVRPPVTREHLLREALTLQSLLNAA
jgi:SNF2 family DNA or RNA helicase